jgi:hypothetical protein
MAEQQEVAGRRNRQELGQSLDEAQEQGLEQMHHRIVILAPNPPSARRF